MRINLHKFIAIWWLIGAPIILAPIVPASTLPDINHRILAVILSVFALIMLAPASTKFNVIKRWFCWTDALNDKQREALFSGRLKEYRMNYNDEFYFARVKPYVFRFISLSFVVICCHDGIINVPKRRSNGEPHYSFDRLHSFRYRILLLGNMSFDFGLNSYLQWERKKT